MYSWQVFAAAATTGPASRWPMINSTSLEIMAGPPPGHPTPPPSGPSADQGKFGTPFARMHFDIEMGTFGAPYG